ncbi:MAG: lipid II:glycine glycyltransferase FemX [Anaerolineales bacterium]
MTRTSLQVIEPQAARWDAFVAAHPRGHLLQISAWGELKAAFGWQPARVALEDLNTGALVAGAQMLLRRWPLGKLAYVPFGPVVDWAQAEHIDVLMDALHRAAQAHGAGFTLFEPGFDVPQATLRAAGLSPSPHTIQPPNTILLTLDDEAAILKRMNQGTRRNIRKAEKAGVTIREATRADLASFNAMLGATGDRQAFGVHAPEYYEKAYELFVPSGAAALLLASAEGEDLAGVFVFKCGTGAWYLYGASRDAQREKRAAFGVQWAGVQWALAHGCRTYDMVGVPDAAPATLEDEFETRSDGLWGVYRFKRGWGGAVRRTVGAWYAGYTPLAYTAYNVGLRARRWLRR